MRIIAYDRQCSISYLYASLQQIYTSDCMSHRPTQMGIDHLPPVPTLKKQSSSPIKPKQKQRLKQTRLVMTIFRLAPKIISYARIFSKKMKKKNTHQLMLFPSSVYQQQLQFVSPDRNEPLIREYSKKYQNDWYPFFFAGGNVFIDNRHLYIFEKKKQLNADIKGLGRVLCFGQFVRFTKNSNTVQRSSKRQQKQKQKQKQKGLQRAQSSFASMINPMQPRQSIIQITQKFRQSWTSLTIQLQQQPPQQLLTQSKLILCTSQNFLILTDSKNNSAFAKITNNPILQINSVSVYKNYITVVADYILYFYKVEKEDSISANGNGIEKGRQSGVKIREVLVTKVAYSGSVRRLCFVKYSSFFFVFFIDNTGVRKLILRDRKISPVLLQQIICQPDKYNPFTNLKIFHESSQNRIILTASCTKQILIYSYHFLQNKQSLILKMPNPKNPPMNPRIHHFSCIQYFVKDTNKPQIGTLQAYHLFRKGNQSQENKNIKNGNKVGNHERKSHQYGDGQEEKYVSLEEEHIIIAVSFTQRVYFVKIYEDRCEVSKRAKFYSRVVKIQSYNQQGIIIILHKQNKQQKQPESSQPSPSPSPSPSPDPTPSPPRLQIIATTLRRIMSFNICIHTQILQKITYQLQINRKIQKMQSKYIFKPSFCIFNNEILILCGDQIERIAICNWKDIYNRMLSTENIQLLNFIILLKLHQSVFLDRPKSFVGVEKFFPKEYAQILLEYYFQTQQEPPKQFIQSILQKNPEHLLPFILEHKIQNLSEQTKEQLIEYYRNKDERIVEELIMAGCEFGWEIAVKKGWMRALRKIVSMGMQIHFPLLKLSAFVLAQVKKLQILDQIGDADLQYQQKCDEVIGRIQGYCQQMVDYTMLALQYFLHPSQITQLQQLKQFILTLLSPSIFQNMIKYKPHSSVKLVSKLFHIPQRVVLMDKFNIQDFLHFQKQYKHIIRTNYVNVSQCIFSYISEVYRQLTQIKMYTMDQQNRFREYLYVQHAKIIRVGIEQTGTVDVLDAYEIGSEGEDGETQGGRVKWKLNNTIGKFRFTRPYLIQMLMVLVHHNNQYVKQIIHEECIEKEKDRDEFQCYIEDLLVKIWLDAKASPLDNVQTNKIQQMPVQEIKSIMISLQQINSTNNFLLICLMLELPQQQYTVKILRKFIFSTNPLIQQRLFSWLMPTLESNLQPQTRILLFAQLMNNLKSIIEINKQKSRQVVDKYFRSKEKDIIRRIDNDPHLQLQYLEMIIVEALENQHDVQPYYLNLYLKLLVEEQPERVIAVLEDSFARKGQKIKYDLQEALKVSLDAQQYPQKNKIQTYLYQKLGQIQKCIQSSLKTLQAYFWKYIQAYQSKQQKKQQTQPSPQHTQSQQTQYKQLNKASKKLSIISQMISHKLHSKNDTLRIQLEQKIAKQFTQLTDLIFRQSIKKYDYFKIPFDAMVAITEEVRHQKLKYKGHYLSMLGHYFGKIVVESFQRDCFRYFMIWLKVQTKIDLNILKKHLHEGYKKVISQETLLTNISFLDKTVLLQNIAEVLIRMQRSIHSQAQCTICNQFFNQYNGQAILFDCGHLFHTYCIDQDQNGQDYCWECMYRNQIQAMIDHSEINIVEIIEKYCMKKSKNMGVERKEKQKEVIISIQKKRMNRLGIFDKKVMTLENQVQILDIKLDILDYYDNLEKKE